MDHILSQVKPAPTFISYFSLTHFNIIHVPTPRTPTKLFLWRCTLLIYFTHVTCLAHLLSHFISHSMKQRGCNVSLLNFMNPPSILNVPPSPHQTPHQRLSCPTPIQITGRTATQNMTLFIQTPWFWTHTEDQTRNGKEYTYMDPHL